MVVDGFWKIYPMGELIMDHGSAFGAHRTDEKGDWDGKFKEYIESYGTKLIRIRVNTNVTSIVKALNNRTVILFYGVARC